MNPYDPVQHDMQRSQSAGHYGAPGQMNAPRAQGAVPPYGVPTMPQLGNPASASQQPPQNGWQQGYGAQQPPQGWQQPYPPQNGWQQPAPRQTPPQGDWQWQGNGYTPAPPTPPRKGGQGGQGGQGGKPTASWRMWLILAAVAAVVVACVVLGVRGAANVSQANALREYVMSYENRYCQGVYVDGVHLGGMTPDQALQAVQAKAQQSCDSWRIELLTPSDRAGAAEGEMDYVGEINAAMLGMTVDVHDALNEAWKQGHTGTDIRSRKAEMDALLETPYYGSTAQPSGNTSAVDTFLQELANAIYLPPQDATFEFHPENAAVPFAITPETNGRRLNVEALKREIDQLVATMTSGTIVFEPEIISPSVTAEQIRQKTALRASAYTKVSTTSTENRNLNLKRACELISGTVIQPGQNFSFNGIVGARSKKNGFYLAIEYAYGEQREGYGGGVCQVSSTVYWAAVRANLEIVKREQHSLAVNYTDFGYDATVNYDGRKIDLVFKNNTDSPIYIVTMIRKIPSIDRSRDLVYCYIYGPALESGVTYDIKTVEKTVPIPAEVETKVDKDAQYVIYTDETHTIKGSVGYEVDSYKVKYVDGKEVERTPLYHDSYAPTPTVVYTGASERPLN